MLASRPLPLCADLFDRIEHEIECAVVGEFLQTKFAKRLIRFSFRCADEGEGQNNGVLDEIGDVEHQRAAPRFPVHDGEAVGDPQPPQRYRQAIAQTIFVGNQPGRSVILPMKACEFPIPIFKQQFCLIFF